MEYIHESSLREFRYKNISNEFIRTNYHAHSANDSFYISLVVMVRIPCFCDGVRSGMSISSFCLYVDFLLFLYHPHDVNVVLFLFIQFLKMVKIPCVIIIFVKYDDGIEKLVPLNLS